MLFAIRGVWTLLGPTLICHGGCRLPAITPSPRQPAPQHEDGRRVADADEDIGHENDDKERRP
jgi:hypothetical protein